MHIVPSSFEPIYDDIQLVIDALPEEDRSGLKVPQLDPDLVKLGNNGMSESDYEALTVFYADIVEILIKEIVNRLSSSNAPSSIGQPRTGTTKLRAGSVLLVEYQWILSPLHFEKTLLYVETPRLDHLLLALTILVIIQRQVRQ